MNRARLALIVAGTLLSACVAAPQGSEGAVPAAAPAAAGALASVPSPPPPPSVSRPTPAPAPAEPARFVFSGELTQGGWIRGEVPRGTLSARLDDTEIAIGPDGHFFAGFNRDAEPAAVLSATLADGRTVTEQLTIAPRDWRLERVNADFTAGVPSESFMKRRRPELEAIAAARTAEAEAEGWQQNFIWPARGRISGRFGSQRIYRGGKEGSYHSGLDIAGGGGTPFVAPADGVVVLAAQEPFTLEGHLIIVDHGHGLNSAFLHASEIDVREGDRVRQGQVLGKIGASGRATGPHLHWSLMWRGARLDPLLILGED
ncbi:M23 family metallopeptidase [Altericroceibacterium xinjiangense]|uniref:M23 family metallopeptidase n=1 Tax=Altericroceibacterium xinjiangense TaxID=762261 RepID=UPI000F7F0D27|nr:M23 family metallopeptidase [Altericroceibacterium xinjiangense]